MSRRRRDRSPLGQGAARQRAQRRAPHSSPRAPEMETLEQTPMMKMLRPALRDKDPSAFWVAAAPLVGIFANPSDIIPPLPEGVDQLDTFLEIDVAETTALLHMVAAMAPGEDLRSRARLGLTARRQPMPPQITGLADAVPGKAVAFADEIGENVMVELVLPREIRAVLIAYISFVGGPWVKDAFVVPGSMESLLAKYRQIMAQKGESLEAVLEMVTPAEAGARLADALAGTPLDEETPGQSEQWPLLRPFMDFVVRLLPGGGAGYRGEGSIALHTSELPPWVLDDGTDLATEFATSATLPEGVSEELAAKVAAFLMVMIDDLCGDPLVWDVEIATLLFGEVLPTTPLLSEEVAGALPAVAPALIEWSLTLTRRDPEEITQMQRDLAPLIENLPALREDPRMKALRLEETVDFTFSLDHPSYEQMQRADLALRAGGLDMLDALDAEPLPAEELAIERIPKDVRDLAAEIDTHLVRGVSDLLALTPREILADEVLTACRRLLVRVAELDDAVLRRKANPRITAAALASLIARGNDIMGTYQPLQGKHLKQAFALRSDPNQRSRALADAAALPFRFTGIALADPGLLIGHVRAELIEKRDALEAGTRPERIVSGEEDMPR